MATYRYVFIAIQFPFDCSVRNRVRLATSLLNCQCLMHFFSFIFFIFPIFEFRCVASLLVNVSSIELSAFTR